MTATANAPALALRSRPRTICVLGGTGFVGSEIVARLAARRDWVRVPTRAATKADHLLVLPTVEVRVANVHDPHALGELFAGADAVVNLVGILNERGRSGAGFRHAHTQLAARVIEAARAQRVPRLLHMSALGADPAGPSHYLRTKSEAESAVRGARGSLEWTIFRPSVIFGPRDSLTNRFARLLRVSGGVLPLARASARFAPIHVGDVADAFIRALDDRSTTGQIYELCGPDVMTLEQIVRITAEAAGLRARIVRLPNLLARLQATLFDFVPGKPFSTDNYRSLAIDSVCRDDGCARLGIEPSALSALSAGWLRRGLGVANARIAVRSR
jgi:uncharacterized protein YbjT (DUF2867 family)